MSKLEVVPSSPVTVLIPSTPLQKEAQPSESVLTSSPLMVTHLWTRGSPSQADEFSPAADLAGLVVGILLNVLAAVAGIIAVVIAGGGRRPFGACC